MNTNVVLHLGKNFKDSELCKKLQDGLNTTHYEFISDWYKHFKDIEFKQIILECGEHKDGPDKLAFGSFDEAVIKLLRDTLDNISSVFELDKIPMSLIRSFHENDIDGGVLFLASDGIKVENLLQIPEIEKKIYNYKLIKSRYEKLQDKPITLHGKKFLLTFQLIKIVLNNDLIKDVELKERTIKFYSCYEKYMKTKKEMELVDINKIKTEIKELSEDTRKQMILDGNLKRYKDGLQFDDFLYWTYLLKSGDIFEGKNEHRYEIVEVEIYPVKLNSSTANTNHSALIRIKPIGTDLEPFSCNFLQYCESGKIFKEV